MTVAVMIVSGLLEPRVGSAGAAILSPVLAVMLVSTMGMLVFMAVRGVEFDLFGWLAPVLVGAAAITGMAMVPTVLGFLARRVVIGWDR